MEKRYYIYVFLDDTKPGEYIYSNFKFEYEPFYVGKGTEDRIINSYYDKQTFKSNKIKSIKNRGGKIISLKLFENLTNISALEIEKEIIKIIGRRDLNKGPLTNLTDGGDGRLTSPHSEETKLKISKTKKSQNLHNAHTKETKDILREINKGENNPMFGKTHTEKVKEEHSLRVSGMKHPMFGKKHNDETVQKIKESVNKPDAKRKHMENIMRVAEKAKKIVFQYDSDMNFIAEYPSAKEAAQLTNIPESSLNKSCRGEIKGPLYKKYYFRYKDGLIKNNSFVVKINDNFEYDGVEYSLIKRFKKTAHCKDSLGSDIFFRLENVDILRQKEKIKL